MRFQHKSKYSRIFDQNYTNVTMYDAEPDKTLCILILVIRYPESGNNNGRDNGGQQIMTERAQRQKKTYS